MTDGSLHNRGLQLVAKATGTVRMGDWSPDQFDPDGLQYLPKLLAGAHWCIVALCLVELLYRPYYGYWSPRFVTYALLIGLLTAFNACLQYNICRNRRITWRWFFSACVIQVATTSVAVAITGGYSHLFFHLFYYLSLAFFALFFTSFRLNLAWVTMVAGVYLLLCVFAGEGLNFQESDEKILLVRLAVMYVVVSVNLVARFERTRWRRAVAEARALQHDRVEFSQAVHDTTAQAAYMIGLAIDTAREQAGDTNPELSATLAATSELSRYAIWELRHPINMGDIYEGGGLGSALSSHTANFANVTSVPAEMIQTGMDPGLSMEDQGLLFTIAHNALTNSYRHAEAGRVSVHLEFGDAEIRLSVSDDGRGLPEDYGQRGRGFTNLRRHAERLGGRLEVERRGTLGGATVTCLVPTPQEKD